MAEKSSTSARKLRVALVWNGTVEREETLDWAKPVVLDSKRLIGRPVGMGARVSSVAAIFTTAVVLGLASWWFRDQVWVSWSLVISMAGFFLWSVTMAVRPFERAEVVFPLPVDAGADVESATLLTPHGSGFRLNLGALPFGGSVWLAGQRREVRDLGAAPIDLGADDYGVLTLGSVAFFFQFSPASPAPRSPFAMDGGLWMSHGLSLFVHVGCALFFFLALAEMDNPDPLELDADLVRRFMVTPPPEDIIEPPTPSSGTDTSDPGIRDREEAGGTQADGAEGRVGRTDAEQEQTEMEGEVTGGAAARVRTMGLLGVLADPSADDSPLAALTDGPSVSDILGGLGSSRTVYGRGSGGSGLRGEGSGGGGTGPGTLFGGGGVGTGVGVGSGSGGGRGRGGPGAPGRERREARVTLDSSPRVSSGYLSPEQIMRVVRQNQAAIRYCYEGELQRNPSLRGRIEISWHINMAGAVTTSRVARSTMGNPRVEGCIVRQVRRWRFPQPDGGEVDVVFPFIFGAGG